MSEVRVKESTLQGIADAIRAKDGTESPIVASTFAQRILDIPSGGGSAPFVYGEFTLAEDTKELEVTHDLGAEPTLFCAMCLDNAMIASSKQAIAVYFYNTNSNSKSNAIVNNWGRAGIGKDIPHAITDTTFKIGNSDSSFPFLGGKSYMWIAM